MIRHAVRRLMRARTFALAAIATLTIGVGGTAGVFTLVDDVLLRPLPYPHADRLVDLSHTLTVSGVLNVDQSDATYLLYARDNHVFTDVGAYRTTAVNVAGLTGSEGSDQQRATRVDATVATASVFRVLRAAPAIGRGLTEQDDEPGATPVVLVSHSFWLDRLGGTRSALEKTLSVDGVVRRIVGVMPDGFDFPDARSMAWIPLQIDPANTKSAAFDFRGIARLRDGVSLAAATADLQRLLPRVPEVFPGRLTVAAIAATHMHPVVRPLRDVVVGDVGHVLWIVLGAVVLLLVLACANVANLFLARAEARHRELAIRSALGAERGQLLLELLSEALLVAITGGVLGLLGATWGVRGLESMSAAASIPRLAEVRVDWLVVALGSGVAALAAVVVSILPLLRLNSSGLVSMLVGGNRSATSGRSRHRTRRSLVAAQVASALVLVFAAGLFMRSFARLRSVDVGFAQEHALTFRVALSPVTYSTTQSVANLVVRTLADIQASADVRASGVITNLPLDAESRQDSAVYIQDHPISKSGIPDLHPISFVTPGYFRAMGIALLAGRGFDEPEPSGQPAAGPPVAIVSAAFAARYWRGGPSAALGKQIRLNPTDPWETIVGVVGSVRGAGLEQPPTEDVYCPLVTVDAAHQPWAPRDLAFVVRTYGDAPTIAAQVHRVVAALDPGLPLYRVMPLSDLTRAATARTTFTLDLLTVAAIVATILGALGIYAVIAYLVSLRTREIGVRLALGADARTVRLMVIRQATTDALAGIVVGVVMSLGLARALGVAIYGISPTDPATLATASVLLLVTAVAASWIPGRRASKLDPSIALRAE